jgi:hypothetical protein
MPGNTVQAKSEVAMIWTNVIAGVLILSFAVYLLLLFRIAFGNIRMLKPAKEKDSEYTLESLLSRPCLDCELALLWQTEVPALEKLKQSVAKGLSEGELRALYSNIASHYPELCDGLSFDKWVQTLERLEVIARIGDTFTITEKGLFILDFANEQTKCPCEDLALSDLTVRI